VNAIERTVDGEADLSGPVQWGEHELARVRMSTLLRERTLDIHEFRAEALGGSVTGQAAIPLGDWRRCTAAMDCQGIEPRLLAQWMPAFERFEGKVQGSLKIEETDRAARPPEPMQFAVDAHFEDGGFGSAHIDSCRLAGFFGDRRLLVDEASFGVLGGRLRAKGRISNHRGGHPGSLVVDFNDLRLNQLVHVIDPNADEYAGRLSGNGTVLTSSDWHSFGGELRLNLTQSDLVGSGVVRALYNTLNLQLGKQQPTGTGEVIVQLEGSSVVIPSFAYFNRGVEIRGAGRIVDVNRGAQSPVEGFAVGSTRVLRGIQLPGIKELDRMLASFQAGAASVKIAGTVGKVEPQVVPLPEVLAPFRGLLWTQLHE